MAEINGPRCGACDQPFPTAKELIEHLDVCEEAQASPEVALFNLGRALKRLGESIDSQMRHCDACGSEYIDGAMCPVCYGSDKTLARWHDDGGQG